MSDIPHSTQNEGTPNVRASNEYAPVMNACSECDEDNNIIQDRAEEIIYDLVEEKALIA